jgi:hypothetical protein
MPTMNLTLRPASAGGCAIFRLTALALTLVMCSIVMIRASLADPLHTGMADPVALEAAFGRVARAGQTNLLVLSLANLRSFSGEAMNAGGTVTIDLAGGSVTSVVRGVPADCHFDLWLVDNRPGPDHGTLAEASDSLMNVGTFEAGPGGHRQSVTLGRDVFTDFFPDRAFVVRSGENPVNSFVLTGRSTLFARLQHQQVRFVDAPAAAIRIDHTAVATCAADFERIVAQGRQLFLDEAFNGNGRTCGTCYVETNNFTLDPNLIATLPPNNPLFVAETNALGVAATHLRAARGQLVSPATLPPSFRN